MTDFKFVSLFKIDELPECAQGLSLLKGWIESDPETVSTLQQNGSFNMCACRSQQNLTLQAWLEHLRTCPDCLLLGSREGPLPQRNEQSDTGRDTSQFRA